MKKKYIIAALSACSLAAASFFFFPNDKKENFYESETEEAEEYRAAEEWRFMRLRDPATGKIPDHIREKELAFVSSLPSRESGLTKKNSSLLGSGAEWRARGPWNVGGRTRALGLDVANENIILAGGVSGGMWRSSDAGNSWAKTTSPDQLHSVSCLAQDTRQGKTNIWYYGTGERFGGTVGSNPSSYSGNGLFKSTDNGLSWKQLDATTNTTPGTWDNQFEYIWNVATDPSRQSEDVVYAATCLGGIYRSSDGGNTWKQTLPDKGVAISNGYSYYSDVAVGKNGVAYAAMSEAGAGSSSTIKGLYRSTDGITWKNITPANFPSVSKRIVVAIAPSDDNQVYFLGETPGSGFEGIVDYGTSVDTNYHSLWKYTYVSSDGTGSGGVWENRSQNLPAFGLPSGNFVSQGSYDLVIRVKPDNADQVFIGGTNLYRSTDGFATNKKTAWIGGYGQPDGKRKYPEYPNHHSDQHGLFFKPSNPNILYSANDGGMHVTNDAMAQTVAWSRLNNGYITTQFYHIAIDHATPNDKTIIGGTQDYGSWFTQSDKLTDHWFRPLDADGAFCAIADGRTSFYMSKQSGKTYRILINGSGDTVGRTRIDPVGIDRRKELLFINPFALDPNNNKTFYFAGGTLIWRNDDPTQIPLGSDDSTSINWTKLTKTEISSSAKISALAITKIPSNTLYYGTSAGKVYKLENANSNDATPVEITGAGTGINRFPGSAFVSCIAVDPEDGNKVFVVFSNYGVQSIFYSENGGKSWQAISGNLEQNLNGGGNGPSITSLTMLKVQGKMMYFAGTSTGLYSTSSLDGMSTIWALEGESTIGNVIVEWLDSRSSDGYIVAATYGNGIYSANITTFPTASLPAEVQLVAPSQQKNGIGSEATFQWKKANGAIRYRIQIAKDSAFTNIIYDQSGINDTTASVFDLEAGIKTYYWRVRATNEGGSGAYSEVRSFRTIISTPELVSPSGDIASVSPTLIWNKTDNAEYYHIQVSTKSDFSTTVLDKNNYSDTTIVAENLSIGTRYYWRVAAFGDGLEGGFARKVFRVVSTSAEEFSQEKFSLMQNYPNPCSANTTIKFETQKKDVVNLSIFDVSGKNLFTAFEKEFSPGEHRFSLDVRNLPSGTYYYTLRCGKHTQTKALQVVR